MFKINDWVKHAELKIKGKVIAVSSKTPYNYVIKWNDNTTGVYERDILKRYDYIHKEIQIGIFRFSFFKLDKKWSIRFELSQGWE